MRSTIAGSVSVSRIRPPPAFCDIDRALAGGAQDAAERLRQLAQLGERLLQIGLADAAPRPSCRGSRGAPVQPTRASRSTRRTSSRSVSTFSLRTSLVSTSSRMCEPPCRSSPSTMWRCAHAGQLAPAFREEVRDARTGRRKTPSAGSPSPSSAKYRAWSWPSRLVPS